MSSAQIFAWLSPLISWLFAVAFFVTWTRRSGSRYILAVAAAYFFQGSGFFLSHVSRDWSPLLHFIPGQFLYFAGLVTLASAFCMRVGRPLPIRTMVVVSALAIAYSTFLHSAEPLSDGRLVITNLGQGLILALAAWTIRPNLGNETNTDKGLYWVVLVTAAQFFIRPILSYLVEGSVAVEELRGSIYWAVMNATVMAFSLLLAISLVLAIINDIIDELAKRKDTADASHADLHKRAIKSVLTKEEIEMLLEP